MISKLLSTLLLVLMPWKLILSALGVCSIGFVILLHDSVKYDTPYYHASSVQAFNNEYKSILSEICGTSKKSCSLSVFAYNQENDVINIFSDVTGREKKFSSISAKDLVTLEELQQKIVNHKIICHALSDNNALFCVTDNFFIAFQSPKCSHCLEQFRMRINYSTLEGKHRNILHATSHLLSSLIEKNTKKGIGRFKILVKKYTEEYVSTEKIKKKAGEIISGGSKMLAEKVSKEVEDGVNKFTKEQLAEKGLDTKSESKGKKGAGVKEKIKPISEAVKDDGIQIIDVDNLDG